MNLRRVHGDNSIFEACCWVAVVALLLALAAATALMVAPR